MSRVVFLLEEPSMKAYLEELLPRMFPRLDFLCVSHEGKQDLEKSIPRKLRAWNEPGVRFVVVRDNDGADCRAVKKHLRELCKQGRRPETLIRIACQQLEAWHLGDFDSLASAYAKSSILKQKTKAKYTKPDGLINPAQELSRLVPEFRKIDGARRMGRVIPIDCTNNRSRSFQVFVEGIQLFIRN